MCDLLIEPQVMKDRRVRRLQDGMLFAARQEHDIARAQMDRYDAQAPKPKRRKQCSDQCCASFLRMRTYCA